MVVDAYSTHAVCSMLYQCFLSSLYANYLKISSLGLEEQHVLIFIFDVQYSNFHLETLTKAFGQKVKNRQKQNYSEKGLTKIYDLYQQDFRMT